MKCRTSKEVGEVGEVVGGSGLRGRLKCWQQVSPLLDPLPTTTRQQSNCMNFPRYRNYVPRYTIQVQHPHVQTFRNLDNFLGL